MVLNMLNLYTFILASFSKIGDMTVRLQEIKQVLINNISSKPAELLAGKHDTVASTLTTISGNILYNILNTTQSSTVSSCYIEKVNCSTKFTADSSYLSSTTTTPPLTSSQSSSTITTLTTLLLLSSTLSSTQTPSDTDINERNQSIYDINNDTFSFINDSDDKLMKYSILDRIYDYNSINDKKSYNKSKKNVNITTHYILPFVFKAFNYDKKENDGLDYDKNDNETEEDFLTPEDYPDNETDIIYNIPDSLNFTTLEDNDNYTHSTTLYTTDDGCQYITICPDIPSTVSGSSTYQSHPTELSTYYSETTEFKTQPSSPSTFTPVVTEETPVDLSLQTKTLDIDTRRKLRSLCWETMFGQELVKLTVMDLVLTIMSTFMVDFFRALFVRVMNNCWCWDLEKKFPQYGDFKIAENILHLVNNQGMVWMGMFFSPGLPLINLIKLVIMMYLRSWAVLTCNVPHEVVFRASRSNNFYLALLLTMLFLCVLPVSYAIVWVEPSWHCGPFSNYEKIYHLFTNSTKKALPNKVIHRALDYIASPGIVIPLLLLLVLIIYYLISLTNALREANNDLKIQLRRERTEERRKVFQMVDRKHRGGGSGDLIDSTPFHKWQKTLNVLPNNKLSGDQISDPVKENNGHNINGDIKSDAKKLLSKLTKHSIHKQHSDEECIPIVDADGTDIEQVESLPDDRIIHQHHHLHKHKSNNINQNTVPAEVHKTEPHNIKKHHDTVIVIHHKHDKIEKQDEHDKNLNKHDKQDDHKHIIKHSKTEKYDKHHISNNKDIKKHKDFPKQDRKDSSTSIPSETIPEILISQTDSPDESEEEINNFDQPSKSSSVDTIIATDTADQLDNDLIIIEEDQIKNKKKKKISYKINKPITEDDIHTNITEGKHKKHHKNNKLEHTKDELNKKHGILIESKHIYKDKGDLKKDDIEQHDDKVTTVHSGKDKSISDKTLFKIKSKEHKTKEYEKNDENIIKKYQHDDVLIHKDKKNESEHHKEHKKETYRDSVKKHDLHHDDDDDEDNEEKHHTKKQHDHTKKQHTQHDQVNESEKKLKSKQKGKINILHKSDNESDGEDQHKIIKKKKHVSEDKKSPQQHQPFVLESSFKLKPKNESSHNISSANSTTDESNKSHKKIKMDKKISDVIENKDSHKHNINYKNEEKVVHKIHKEKQLKDKHDDKNKNIDKHKLDDINKDHKNFKIKKKDDKIYELKDHKLMQEKDINKYKKKKESKESLPQTSSDNDLTEYEKTDNTNIIKSSDKKIIKRSNKKSSSDQSVVSDDKKHKNDKFDNKIIKEKYHSDDEIDDNNKSDANDDEHKIIESSDDSDLNKTIKEDSDDDDDDDNNNNKSQIIKKGKLIKQRLPFKSKKVVLIETDSKQSSCDSHSIKSEQSNSLSIKDDDDDDDYENYDDENYDDIVKADSDDSSSKDHSNESVKERST